MLFSYSLALQAGNDVLPVGARSAGLGHASVSLSDVWSAHHNQAGLAFVDQATAGIYFENRFLVRELSLGAGAFALPTKSGTFGVSFQSFGYSFYNQSRVGLGYGLKLSDRFAVGVQLNYHQTVIGEGYGSASTVTAEVGLLYQLSEDLTLGAHIFNPNRSRFADFNDERLPSRIRVGLQYAFSDKLLSVLEVEQDIDFTPVLKGGIEYLLNDILFLRVGFNGNPTTTTFGAGLKFDSFQFDLGMSYHFVLGYSPQVSLLYAF
ncbi:MAG: hypothetical protein ACXITV_11360 [Luteibaculaceae bacterium]